MTDDAEEISRTEYLHVLRVNENRWRKAAQRALMLMYRAIETRDEIFADEEDGLILKFYRRGEEYFYIGEIRKRTGLV